MRDIATLVSSADYQEELPQFGEPQIEAEIVEPELVIDRPFDPSKIKVTTEKKTIDLLVRRIEHGEIDLAPEFQRRARVWPIHRKSQLIESLLLRIPLPVFYVSADADDRWAVVDGLQRITTIDDFMRGAFKLSGLEYLTSLEGCSFSGLDRSMKRRIEETELVINVIQPGTPEEVMINIFKRINTGGSPLNGQEIRNALNKGPVREYLRELASHHLFVKATAGSIKDDRMEGQEMALRFLAFSIFPFVDYKVNDLDHFLNEAMRKINAMAQSERDRLQQSFLRSLRIAHEIFGVRAFRKPRVNAVGEIDGRLNPISKPLFEVWTVALSKITDQDASWLESVEGSRILREAFFELMLNDSDFVTSISYSTGAPSRVFKRFQSIQNIVSGSAVFA